MRAIDNNYCIKNQTALRKKEKRHSVLIERKTFNSVARHSYLWIATYLCKTEIAVGDNCESCEQDSAIGLEYLLSSVYCLQRLWLLCSLHVRVLAMITSLVLTRYMAKCPADNSTLNSILFTLSASWSFVIHATGLAWNYVSTVANEITMRTKFSRKNRS